jgi:membrane-associated phospholipid phosphatase
LWAAVTIEFAIVFIGGDFVTAHRAGRLNAFLSFELSIPLVPSMVIAYMSIYLIWIPAPFLLHERRQVNRLAIALALVILIAGIGFLAFPAELGFPPMGDDLARLDPISAGRWGPWLRLADLLNLDYDLIPSLHVAMFVTTAGAYACRSGRMGKIVLGIWSAAVVASTVLTHQHHVIDAIAGIALGLGGARVAARGLRRTPA